MEYLPLQTSLRDLLLVLFKRKWSILTIIVLTILGSAVYLWVIRENLYTASAKIMVKLGQEQAPPPTVLNGMPMVTGYRFQEVNSEVEILASYDLIAGVVDEFKLYQPGPLPPPPPGGFALVKYRVKALVKDIQERVDELMIQYGLKERIGKRESMIVAMQNALSAHPQKDTNIFIAELTLPYRQETAVILNRLVDNYLDYRTRIYKTQGGAVFRERADRLRTELDNLEHEVQTYEMQGDISVLGKQQEQLVTQIASAEGVLRAAEVAEADASSKVARLEKEMQKPEPNFGNLGEFDKDSFPQGILRQLAELQREREKLRMTELDTGDRVQNNRSQFKVLADMLAANLRSVEADRRSETGKVKAAYESLKDRLSALHSRQKNWEDLKRKSKDTEEMYGFYRRKQEETSTLAAMENGRIGNVTVIQRAADPIVPTGLRKTRMMGVAVVVAIFLALAWASIAEFFDHRIYTAEELERRLTAPVLGVVPSLWRPLAGVRMRSKDAPVPGANA